MTFQKIIAGSESTGTVSSLLRGRIAPSSRLVDADALRNYDGVNLVEETNASSSVVARYSQGASFDEPLAMFRSATTNFYEEDGLGSVTLLSNAAGAVVQTYTLDSFGNQTASSGSLTNPFQYKARELDSETSLYYMRALF